MPDIKWFKLATAMPDDEKMKLIDAVPERDVVHYLWIRLLLQAGKTNADGDIFLSEDIPYTDKMLAILFSRPLASIKLALKTLSRLGMIEIAPDKVIRIVNLDKHQNLEGMERVREQNRKRAENHREKKKEEMKEVKSNSEIYENIALDENKELENIVASENKVLEDHRTLNKYELKENLENNEKIIGKVGGCDYVALRSAIDIYGQKRVKMAMDVGFERNCPEIKYAIGVLKNWRREGYPKDDMEVKTIGFRSTGKSNSKDKNEFARFKPKEPRKLT